MRSLAQRSLHQSDSGESRAAACGGIEMTDVVRLPDVQLRCIFDSDNALVNRYGTAQEA